MRKGNMKLSLVDDIENLASRFSFAQNNAGTAISGIENKETVMVKRISTVPAERVVVSPLETLTSAPLASNYLINALGKSL